MIYGSQGRGRAHVERRALSSLLITAARPALRRHRRRWGGSRRARAPSSAGLEPGQALQKLTS